MGKRKLGNGDRELVKILAYRELLALAQEQATAQFLAAADEHKAKWHDVRGLISVQEDVTDEEITHRLELTKYQRLEKGDWNK
jgi:hypothetical protein